MKFSVVIANYNNGTFLGEAIESVLRQDGADFELIVCDAGSTDGSVAVINQHSEDIAWWCSESDGGQSEAFNKGFSHASGDVLTWLNADDIMMPRTLKAVRRALESHKYADWATGNFLRFRQDDKTIIEAKWGPHILPCWLQGNGFPLQVFGPTTFWRRSAYDEIGPIDEKLHYTMDTDYWQRLIVAGKNRFELIIAVGRSACIVSRKPLNLENIVGQRRLLKKCAKNASTVY